jgi:hypothetical protein
MTITFENDNDVIIYALEKVIAYARRTQQIFVAQCVWWLASIFGLEQGLVDYIRNKQSRLDVTINPEKELSAGRTVSPTPRDIQEETRQDQILRECENYLQESSKLRTKISVNTGKHNRINPLASTKKLLRVEKYKRKSKVPTKTEGINESEIQRRKVEGECLRCAWPANRKGTHQVKDCIRPIKLDKGSAYYPKAKEYQKIKQSYQKPSRKEVSTEASSSEETSDDLL